MSSSTGYESTERIAWRNMRDRCRNTNAQKWEYYGGRGVTMCDRWLVYENFLKDMGRKPSPELTLERVDNAKGYEPGNCRWATRSAQNRNRRTHKRNKFGAKGVSWEPRRKRYLVTIGVDGKSKYVGLTKTLEAARELRAAAERKYWQNEDAAS